MTAESNERRDGARPASSLAAVSDQGLAPGTPGIRQLLERSRAQIAAALPKHLTVERMLRVCMTAVQTTPGLMECSPLSVIGGVIVAAQLGLEIGGPLGHAYLVPYKKIATFIPGYRGMVDLARRSGAVSTVEARIVRKRDRFSYELGLNPRIDHVPYMGDLDPGPAIAVYAICKLRDGSVQFDVLSKRDVELVMRSSASAGRSDSPWSTSPDEMWKKTAIRRLWKLLPVSVERAMGPAIMAHDAHERGEAVNPVTFVDAEDLSAEPKDPPKRRTTTAAREEAPADGAGDAPEDPRGRSADAPNDRGDDDAPREERKPETKKPADPARELLRALGALRSADPEAFEHGFDLAAGAAPRLDLTKTHVDTLRVGLENATAWRKNNPRRES